jgi:hypothetical protein
VDRLTAAIVAAPALLGAGAWLVMLLTAASTGTHPIWHVEAQSLAEAAALRDGPAIVRYIEDGADPDQPGNVRAHIVSDEPRAMTPLQAAVASRDRDIVQLVLDEGASGSAR